MRKIIEYKFPAIRLVTDRLMDFKYRSLYKNNSKRFKKMKNIHEGERCFLIGCGPSLRNMDLSVLKNEICFGVNSLVMNDSELGIECKYYGNATSATDYLKWIEQGLEKPPSSVFLFRNAARLYFSLKKTHRNAILALKTQGLILRARGFPPDISKQIYGGGGTIMIPCLQVCFYLGFKEVYLLGCDCSYAGKSVHFDSQHSAFSGGSKEEKHWNQVFDAYRICKKEFEKDNRVIYNVTPSGSLDVFERRNLGDVLNESS